MRRQRGLVGLMGLAALVGLGVVARPGVAKVTTEQSASILVFPKVIANPTFRNGRDTVIQITNTSNNMRHAHCFYVNGAPLNPYLPPGPDNPPLWTEIDFDIWLTKQQPTHWVVSTGRLDNPLDRACRGAFGGSYPVSCDPASVGQPGADCCDAGFDPGRVPPVAPDFTGELKCVEVDGSGFPVPGNALKGEATIETISNGDIVKYNAVGLKGFDTNNGDGTLCLGGEDGEDGCPDGAEYEGCPRTWLLDHYAHEGETPAWGIANDDVYLTVVPCTENFETQAPTSITLQFAITNEYEQVFSASTTVTCWATWNTKEINDIFDRYNIGSDVLFTRMRSAAGTPGGVLSVLEERFKRVEVVCKDTSCVGDLGADGVWAASMQNVQNSQDDVPVRDYITIPAEQIQGQ
jgi:hypothetical protein